MTNLNSTNNKVRETQLCDTWSASSGVGSAGPAICRWRTPILGPPDVEGYGHVVKVVWIYGPENSDELPSELQSEQMNLFENRLCDAWESDGHAYLAAVLTFDGARQWVFYTPDVSVCGQRLHAMPQEEERYPLELTSEHDPEWLWLRKHILKRFE